LILRNYNSLKNNKKYKSKFILSFIGENNILEENNLVEEKEDVPNKPAKARQNHCYLYIFKKKI